MTRAGRAAHPAHGAAGSGFAAGANPCMLSPS